MGASKRRREAFFQAHPICCFCGNAPATTVDHVPARGCFRARVGPEGFEFPACAECNGETRVSEQVFAFLARVFNAEEEGPPEDLASLVRHLRNNAPDCLPKADLSANQKRKILAHWKLTPAPGQTYADAGLVQVPRVVNEHITIFGKKLLRALYYRELARPIPSRSSALVGYSQLQIPSTGEAVRLLGKGLPGVAIGTRRNTAIGEQFGYRWGFNEGEGVFGVMAQFGRSILVLAATAPTDLVRESPTQEGWFDL